MKPIVCTCLVSCSFICCLNTSFAESTSEEDVVLDTEEIVVEDTEEVLTVGTVGTETPDVRTRESISGKALDDTAGLSLGGALESVSGVRAVESGATTKPMIHGFFGSRLLILFDEICHEAQSWGLDHAPEIDPASAGKLTVIKGAGGVRYGSNAIGGVVLVAPPKIPVEPGVKGSFSLFGNSNNRGLGGSLTLRGRSTDFDALGWRLQTSAKKAGSISTPDYILDNTGNEEYNVSGAVHWDKPTYNFQIGASRFGSNQGVFTGQVAENSNQFKDLIAADIPPNVNAFTFDYDIERPRQDVEHTLVYTRLKFDTLPSIRTTIEAAHQINKRLEFDKVRKSVDGPQLDFKLNTTSGKILAEFDALDHIFGGIGIEGRLQENVFQGVRLIPNYRTFSGGVFGWSQFVFESWEAEIGARLDYESVETFQRARIGGASAPIEENQFKYLTPSFVAGILWRPVDVFKSNLTFSSASRAPTVNELFIDGVSQGLAGFEEGDKDLDVERSYSLSMDLTYTPARWLSANVTGHAKYITDYIHLSPKLDRAGVPSITTTINGGFPTFAWSQSDSTFYGADAELEILPSDWLEFRSTASVVFARDVGNDKFLTLIPAPFFEQELRMTREKIGPFSHNYISVKSELNLKQTQFDANSDFTDPPDASHLIHVGAGTEWEISTDSTLSVDLDCRNLLNTKYRNYLSRLRYFAHDPGRAIFLRMKLTL